MTAGSRTKSLWQALGEHAAQVKHHGAVDQRQQDLHHVLDHDDGDARVADVADQLHAGLRLGGGEAGEHFVQQQDAGAGGERAGDFQPAFLGRGERMGQAVRAGGEPGGGEHALRLHHGVAGAAGAAECADHHVLQHGHAVERADHLEGAGDAGAGAGERAAAGDAAPVEADFAAVGRDLAGDGVEQARFAGAVGPDQPENFAGCDGEADVDIGRDAAERLADPAYFKQRGHRAPRSVEGRAGSPVRRGGRGRSRRSARHRS